MRIGLVIEMSVNPLHDMLSYFMVSLLLGVVRKKYYIDLSTMESKYDACSVAI